MRVLDPLARKSLLGAACAVALVLLFCTVHVPKAVAAEQVYLSLEGNEDDPAADKNYSNWINLESWHWGQSATGERVNRPEFGASLSHQVPAGPGALTLVRPSTAATPKIQKACTSGKSLKKVVFSQRITQQGKPVRYILEDVAVSCKVISAAGSATMEHVTLTFKKIRAAAPPARMKGDFSRDTFGRTNSYQGSFGQSERLAVSVIPRYSGPFSQGEHLHTLDHGGEADAFFRLARVTAWSDSLA